MRSLIAVLALAAATNSGGTLRSGPFGAGEKTIEPHVFRLGDWPTGRAAG